MLGGIDMEFNQVMINALMDGMRIKIYTRVQWTNLSEGIYTGVVVVALWATGLFFSLLFKLIILIGTSSFKK